jgi:hypothetical protein
VSLAAKGLIGIFSPVNYYEAAIFCGELPNYGLYSVLYNPLYPGKYCFFYFLPYLARSSAHGHNARR